MTDAILALNAGSSSVKFGLYRRAAGTLDLIARGAVELNKEVRLEARDPDGDTVFAGPIREANGGVVKALLAWIQCHMAGANLAGVGHRVVHGGRTFRAPVLLTDRVIDEIDSLTPLAPLHQPRCLAGIRELAADRPGLRQVACFDTTFHQTMSEARTRFALPQRFEDEGVRRYGFHGLSYEHVASRLVEIAPAMAKGKVVVAHLGNGASLCAMQAGASVDTTMGFSALDGLVMGTRCGSIDPGVLLFLQRVHGLSVVDLERLLYRESGLLGVSGLSGDMRVLLDSDEPRAELAITLFVDRAAREIAAMAHSLRGMDGLVFTAGIGERADRVRALICDQLAWMGVRMDADANARHAEKLNASDSRVEVRIIPADEESVVAHATNDVLKNLR